MTKLFPLLLVLCSFLISCKQAENRKDSINPVIGNVSFIEKYGHLPMAASEDERIKAHLEYVEQLLRARDVSHLSLEQRQKREHVLALLHDYRSAGSFPKNYDHLDERRPCFIDKHGNICAVGYLVAKTASLALANKINAAHQYDYIADMRIPELVEWVAGSGLTLKECAMIQPTYGHPDPPARVNELPLAYSISTAMLTGANTVFTGVNIRQSVKGKQSSTVALIGLASGIAQTTLGVLNLENNYYNSEKLESVSKMNVGIGAATIVSSVINLVLDKKPKERNTSVSISSFSTIRNEPVMGLTLTRKL